MNRRFSLIYFTLVGTILKFNSVLLPVVIITKLMGREVDVKERSTQHAIGACSVRVPSAFANSEGRMHD